MMTAQMLSFDQIGRLLSRGLTQDQQSARFFTVALFTGLCPCELIALKWEDVDLAGATPSATVRTSFTKADRLHETKTEGSERVVDLRPQAVRALKAQRVATQLKTEFVFASQTGEALDRDNLNRRVWGPALKQAGIRARTMNQCRHKFIRQAIVADEQLTWVAAQVGHTSTAMVVKHYLHRVKITTRQDGSAFDKAAAAGL